jgi:hypothetical protein
MRNAGGIGLALAALAMVARAETGSYEIIKGFSNVGRSFAGIVQGSDGALYGTTCQRGAFGFGSGFRGPTDGFSPSVLHSFDPRGPGQGSDGFPLPGEAQ